jgi:hypothetical protein
MKAEMLEYGQVAQLTPIPYSKILSSCPDRKFPGPLTYLTGHHENTNKNDPQLLVPMISLLVYFKRV